MNWFTWKKKSKDTAPSIVQATDSAETDNSQVIELNVVVQSDVGCIRQNNEDSGRFTRPQDSELLRRKGYLAIVADGMGGHASGEVASQMAVEIISREYYAFQGSVSQSLEHAFKTANRQIYEKAQQNASMHNMGTTCTAVVVKSNKVFYAHVGDSRFYHLKDNTLHQISEDHTWVQEMLRRKEISPEAAATHPDRNMLINAMGTKKDTSFDVAQSVLVLEANDRLLMCSDGLYDYFNSAELTNLLTKSPLHKASQALIQQAKMRGGADNITVILLELPQTEEEIIDEKATKELEKETSLSIPRP